MWGTEGSRRRRGKGQLILEREIGQPAHLQFVVGLIFKVAAKETVETRGRRGEDEEEEDEILRLI